MFVRWLAALIAFGAVAFLGIAVFGDFSADAAGNSWALIAAIGLAVGFVAYAAIEYAQTGGFASIARQFDIRTLAPMPVAIAINIILGAAVANALKIPIYLDSIGTILVGVLAGPIAGAVTGGLANLIWTYILPAPFHSDYAAPFFIVAVEIGLLAGIFGRLGFFRSRPNTPSTQLAIGAAIVIAIVLVAIPRSTTPQPDPVSSYPAVTGQLGDHLKQLERDVSTQQH